MSEKPYAVVVVKKAVAMNFAAGAPSVEEERFQLTRDGRPVYIDTGDGVRALLLLDKATAEDFVAVLNRARQT